MRGLCFGIGAGWDELARRAADRMKWATGLSCDAITERPRGMPGDWHPSWAKLWAWDLVPAEDEAVFVFDADALAVAPCPMWAGVPAGRFACVRERASAPVRNEAEAYGVAQYFNAGLWVLPREHGAALERARAYGPEYGTWMEQTALNVTLAGVPRVYLPRACNHYVNPGEDVREAMSEGAMVLHFTSRKGRVEELLSLEERLPRNF